MHFKAFSAAVFGIDAYLMEVEVDVGSSKPGDFNVVGLPLSRVYQILKEFGWAPEPPGCGTPTSAAQAQRDH